MACKPPDEFFVRKFRDRDLPAIYEIEQEAFRSPWPRSAFLYLAKSRWGARGEILVVERVVADSTPEKGLSPKSNSAAVAQRATSAKEAVQRPKAKGESPQSDVPDLAIHNPQSTIRNPQVVGYACLTWEKGLGHLLNLAVAKSFRQNKLGERLLVASIERFVEKELSVAVLEVRRSNVKAFKLYEKHGFIVHHTEKAYYPDGEDGLVMVKPLQNR
ncbi:MAG: GNAT family N-acetyltransferase [Candidatus Coatesbacteria bacterium]|nr:GNAT family N-acetyltransferase [Candidatus Coatesbacteria bacterium]